MVKTLRSGCGQECAERRVGRLSEEWGVSQRREAGTEELPFPKSCFSVDNRDAEGGYIRHMISSSNCKLKIRLVYLT